VIGEETKEFERRGNIFSDEEIFAMIPELATVDLGKPRTSEEDKLVITNGAMTDLGPSECVITLLNVFRRLNVQSETLNYDISSRVPELSL
jgi:hypothetical protein